MDEKRVDLEVFAWSIMQNRADIESMASPETIDAIEAYANDQTFSKLERMKRLVERDTEERDLLIEATLQLVNQ